VFLAAGVFASSETLANNPTCCFGWGVAPICSPLDTPLRYYYIPRRPAWSPSEFCYGVRGPRDCPPCGPNCQAIPPELADEFAPWRFERLGHIPADALLEAAATAGR
jgi:hypothetical protein